MLLNLLLVKCLLVNHLHHFLQFFVVLNLLFRLNVAKVNHFLNFLDDQDLKLFPGNVLEGGLLLQKIRRVRQHDINRLTEHFIEILNFPSSGQCFVGDLVFTDASEELIDE
jgi:hypothetical protein